MCRPFKQDETVDTGRHVRRGTRTSQYLVEGWARLPYAKHGARRGMVATAVWQYGKCVAPCTFSTPWLWTEARYCSKTLWLRQEQAQQCFLIFEGERKTPVYINVSPSPRPNSGGINDKVGCVQRTLLRMPRMFEACDAKH